MRRTTIAILTAAAFVAATAFAANAVEQKKVSLEQAWRLCKQDVDKTLPNNADHATQRYARAGACMAKYGYRL